MRRHIDLALARRSGRTGLVALDWAKAFDSINAEASISALKRFGVPPKMLRIIEHLYGDRLFKVVDSTAHSSMRHQNSGISQGCPLSPFLFVMLMTIVVKDSIDNLSPAALEHSRNGSLDVLLYADDTLLIGSDDRMLQQLLDKVAEVGSRYGMELHWSKFQLLQINGVYKIRTPGGEAIPAKDLMTYLGVTIYADGGVKNELGKKLGSAWGQFCKLDRLWKRTALTPERKIQILQAVIVSGLLYGYCSAWLNIAEMRRLNGFYCRCLRVLLRIKPAYFSRISNKTVLQRAGQVEVGRQLLKQQLLLYGRIARERQDDELRKLTFTPGSLQPATARYVRRVGRPRNEWAVMVQKEAAIIGHSFIYRPVEWQKRVSEHCCV